MKPLQRLIPTAAVLSGVGLLMSMMGANPVAAQHPKPVKVVLTRDIDNPARTAFFATCFAGSDVGGTAQCTLTTVPPGKLLVVEMFSGIGGPGDPGGVVSLSLLEFDVPGFLGLEPQVAAVPVSTGGGQFVFSQIARAYLPMGTEVRALMVTTTGPSGAQFTVFGYLVDCGPGPGCPIP